MKRFLIIFLLTLPLLVMSQPKKIALLETLNGDKSVQVKGIELNMVRGELRRAVANQPGFQAFTRTDIDQLMKEHGFQKSGMVSDAQRKRLGEMSGADYICVSTLTKSNAEFYLEAYLIEVETGEISNPASKYGILEGGTYANLFQICQSLAQELIGSVDSHSESHLYHPNANVASQHDKDYTETAFNINMKMIYVEGGSFSMGCTREQGGDCDDDEKNVRQVSVDSYYIGMLEVTQSQWFKVMGGDNMWKYYDNLKEENYYIIDGVDYEEDIERGERIGDTMWSVVWLDQKVNQAGQNYPMYHVSYFSAMEFCNRLSAMTGKRYTLPTEAQWEYAARGGNLNKGTRYSGDNKIDNVAWYEGNSGNTVHICGTLRPNELGIYDMSGNVSEWVKDIYSESYLSYDNSNPTGPQEEVMEWTSVITRGGDWTVSATMCRISNREEMTAMVFNETIGFRVVCIP